MARHRHRENQEVKRFVLRIIAPMLFAFVAVFFGTMKYEGRVGADKGKGPVFEMPKKEDRPPRKDIRLPQHPMHGQCGRC